MSKHQEIMRLTAEMAVEIDDLKIDIQRARNIIAAILSHGLRLSDAKDAWLFLDSTKQYGPTEHSPEPEGCHSCGSVSIHYEICDDCMTKLNKDKAV